jgi:exopolysaccharide biosynthesis polyprenyl glycosylphosphotransferase
MLVACLFAMSLVTSLEARRRRRDRCDAREPTARPNALHFAQDDLIAAADDRTRALLARGRRQRRAWLVPRSLALADLLGLSLAYLFATLLWGEQRALGTPRELLVFALTLPCWVLVAKLHDLYGRDNDRASHSTTDDVVGVFHLVTIGVWLLFVASRLLGRSNPDIYALITFWVLAVGIVSLLRAFARGLCRRTSAYAQNTVIVGAGDVGQLVGRKLVRHPEYGANVVGFVDRYPKPRRADLPENLAILGTPERLPEIIERLDVERVVITFPTDPIADLLTLVRSLCITPVQIDLVPHMFELVGPRLTVHAVEGMPLLGLRPMHAPRSARAIKRAIDITGAAVGLVLTAPLFAYIALRTRLDSGRPVLFRQTRLGRHMREFTTLKFRTMRMGTDAAAHRAFIEQTMSSAAQARENGLYKLDRSDAVTRFGAWLRRTSLDELPQLINVLRGEMSLVGPRPCIPYEVEQFEPHHLERFAVPQGLTGLWQVTARANSTFGESLDMDVAYVRDWSLGLDLRLILRTPVQMLRQRSSTA